MRRELRRKRIGLSVGLTKMGRQFSYYCSPEDLGEIEANVFRPAGGRLLVAEKREGRHHIVEVQNFALGLEQMGSEPLFLLLAPPEPLSRMLFDGPWLDTANSHLVEVGRCYIKDGKIRRGRFWYEATTYKERMRTEKPKDFIDWAQKVFKHAKATLSRQTVMFAGRPYREWFGNQAWSEVTRGKLEPVAK